MKHFLYKNAKRCRKCQGTDFAMVKSSDGVKLRCKGCRNSYSARYQRTHPGAQQKRLLQDPQYFRRVKLRTLYRLTVDQFNHMLRAQNGLCAVCNQPEKRKLHGKTAPLVIDHDHRDGRVRGLLCHRCNTMLAPLEQLEWLEKAQAYLQKWRVHGIEPSRNASPMPRDQLQNASTT